MDCRSRILIQIRKAIRESINFQFEHEVDPFNRRWAPLKPSTLRRKRTNRKLYETGRMYHSIRVRRKGSERVVVTSKVDYAIFHLTGTRKMKARPWAVWKGTAPFRGSVWEEKVQTIVEKYLRKCLKNEFEKIKGVEVVAEF